MKKILSNLKENWKNESLQEKELLEIYKTISDDLKADIVELDTTLTGFEWRVDIMNRILREPLSIEDFFYSNMKYWIDDGDWFSVALIERDHTRLGAYVQDNPNFRNRLSSYLLVFSNHTRNLKKYKEDGAVLINEINTFLAE